MLISETAQMMQERALLKLKPRSSFCSLGKSFFSYFGATTSSITTLSTATPSITILSLMSPSILTLSITIKSDTQDNDTLHKWHSDYSIHDLVSLCWMSLCWVLRHPAFPLLVFHDKQGWAIQIDSTIDGTVILLPPKIPWNCTFTVYCPYLHTLVHTNR